MSIYKIYNQDYKNDNKEIERVDILDKMTKSFLSILSEERVLIDEPMKKHTSIRIGGNAKFLLLPRDKDELAQIIKFCKHEEINFMIMGNGSNLLVSDKGFDGVVVKITKHMSDITLYENEDKTIINCYAGASLSSLAKIALENSLKGLEFIFGVPGTVGGGIYMNAGAYGGELKDVVETCTVIDYNGDIHVLSNNDMKFEYRKSLLQESDLILISVEFALEKGNKNEIKAKMDDFTKLRKDKQPLDMPSFGSSFKRPKDNFAGKLIMESGFSGYSIGGAMVSPKHCGFIVNTGGATSEDVIKLIKEIQEKVEKDHKILLEPEVKIV